MTLLLMYYSWDYLTATTAQMLKQTCICYNEVCTFYHSSRSWKYRDFFVKTKTKTKTFISRPRPRPFFMSSRCFETKTKVSRLHPWLLYGTLVVHVSQTLWRWTDGVTLYSAGRPSRLALAHMSSFNLMNAGVWYMKVLMNGKRFN